MIISRTPLRVSFVGGGTDLPDFCDHRGGAVAVDHDRQVDHVSSRRASKATCGSGYSRTEIVERATDPARARAGGDALTDSPEGWTSLTLADVPSQGTGLGSSSAVTVGLLNALYAYQGTTSRPRRWPRRLRHRDRRARQADRPAGPVRDGAGGTNLIEFLPRGGGVRVHPSSRRRTPWRPCTDRSSCSTRAGSEAPVTSCPSRAGHPRRAVDRGVASDARPRVRACGTASARRRRRGGPAAARELGAQARPRRRDHPTPAGSAVRSRTRGRSDRRQDPGRRRRRLPPGLRGAGSARGDPRRPRRAPRGAVPVPARGTQIVFVDR